MKLQNVWLDQLDQYLQAQENNSTHSNYRITKRMNTLMSNYKDESKFTSWINSGSKEGSLWSTQLSNFPFTQNQLFTPKTSKRIKMLNNFNIINRPVTSKKNKFNK